MSVKMSVMIDNYIVSKFQKEGHHFHTLIMMYHRKKVLQAISEESHQMDGQTDGQMHSCMSSITRSSSFRGGQQAGNKSTR